MLKTEINESIPQATITCRGTERRGTMSKCFRRNTGGEANRNSSGLMATIDLFGLICSGHRRQRCRCRTRREMTHQVRPDTAVTEGEESDLTTSRRIILSRGHRSSPMAVKHPWYAALTTWISQAPPHTSPYRLSRQRPTGPLKVSENYQKIAFHVVI